MKDHPKRVNPPQQLADYEAHEAAKRAQAHDDAERVDHEWSNDEVWQMILDGCDQPGEHADPSRYERSDLLDQWRYCTMLCPLHVVPEYPSVPSGVWSREVARAWDRLADATVRHTGALTSALAVDTNLGDDEVCGHVFHATADELRETWDEHRHARWYFEQQADDGYLDIQVVEA